MVMLLISSCYCLEPTGIPASYNAGASVQSLNYNYPTCYYEVQTISYPTSDYYCPGCVYKIWILRCPTSNYYSPGYDYASSIQSPTTPTMQPKLLMGGNFPW
jgi:hypothetical protein